MVAVSSNGSNPTPAVGAVATAAAIGAAVQAGAAFSISPLALPVALVFTLQNVLAYFGARTAA